jgi:hypothetical protein
LVPLGIVLATCVACAAESSLRATDLRCEYAVEPIGESIQVEYVFSAR